MKSRPGSPASWTTTLFHSSEPSSEVTPSDVSSRPDQTTDVCARELEAPSSEPSLLPPVGAESGEASRPTSRRLVAGVAIVIWPYIRPSAAWRSSHFVAKQAGLVKQAIYAGGIAVRP